MLKELLEEVNTLQIKDKFLTKLLSQCISLVSFYKDRDMTKVKIYIDRIEDLIHEYNICFENKEGE